MLHRIGVSINHEELKQVTALQQRFGIRSRSEFFRELVKRYNKLESDRAAVQQCIQGYLDAPEVSLEESKAILRSSLKNSASENWK